MATVHECRANAAECQRTADGSVDPVDRARWQEMAAHWLYLCPDPKRAPSPAVWPMPLYRFIVHNDTVSSPELRTTTLPDDDSAWDYGETIIRTLLQSDLNAEESRLMVIAEGKRVVANIAFNLKALRTKRTLQ